MFGGAFEGKSGQVSMRRIIAFINAIAGIVALAYCLIKGYTEWQTLTAAFGLPEVVSIVLLLFTTWSDLSNTIDSVRGNSKKESDQTEK